MIIFKVLKYCNIWVFSAVIFLMCYPSSEKDISQKEATLRQGIINKVLGVNLGDPKALIILVFPR